MSKAKALVKRTTCDIAAAVAKRYPSNAYAVIHEVGDATGMNTSRHADAIVMSLWPSRGLNLMGFEFKASRGDWMKERDNPAKSEAVLRYCDNWWLAVSGASIVQTGELPELWGLAVVDRGTLKTIKEAPRLDPQPITRDFLAAMLRRVSEPLAALSYGELAAAEEKGRKHELEQHERVAARLRTEAMESKRIVLEYEAASGVRISNSWGGHNPRAVGEAVKAILAGGIASQEMESLNHIRRIAKGILEAVDTMAFLEKAT